MDRIITFRPYLLAAAIAVAGITAHALPAQAAGGGYSGLMAPETDDDAPANNTPSHTEDYKGPGYAGLIASPDGEDQAGDVVQVGQNFKKAIMLNGLSDQGKAAVASIKTPSLSYGGRLTHRKIDGVTDIEYSTKKTIDSTLSTVNDKNLSDDQRSANAKQAYQSLSSLADGFRTKQQIPDSIFKQMGLSDKFISEEKAGNAASLAELNAALNALKPFQ